MNRFLIIFKSLFLFSIVTILIGQSASFNGDSLYINTGIQSISLHLTNLDNFEGANIELYADPEVIQFTDIDWTLLSEVATPVP